MQLMVKAARAGLDKQRGLDERTGRGFVLPSARWRARAQRAALLRRRQRWRRGQVRRRACRRRRLRRLRRRQDVGLLGQQF
eukprot:scaffold49611_cov66-Phaeocystis_antarctica.AAC.4